MIEIGLNCASSKFFLNYHKFFINLHPLLHIFHEFLLLWFSKFHGMLTRLHFHFIFMFICDETIIKFMKSANNFPAETSLTPQVTWKTQAFTSKIGRFDTKWKLAFEPCVAKKQTFSNYNNNQHSIFDESIFNINFEPSMNYLCSNCCYVQRRAYSLVNRVVQQIVEMVARLPQYR
jgi:hypothetical protein